MSARRCSICAINHPVVPPRGHCIQCGGKLDILQNATPDPDFAVLEAQIEREAEERRVAAAKRERFEDYYAHRAVKQLNDDLAVLESEGMDILTSTAGGEYGD